MKQEPFDLEKALAGAKVVTRDGREVVKVYHIPEAAEDKRLLGVMSDGEVESYCEGGAYWNDARGSKHDLFLSVPEPKEVKTTMWMNAWIGNGEFYLHISAAKAHEAAKFCEHNYSSIAEEVVLIRKVEE